MREIPEPTFMERGVVLAPIHLFPLLEAYCSSAAESCPHLMRNTGSCRPLNELEQMGLVTVDRGARCAGEHGVKITEKGRVYVEALLRIPLPVQTWAVPKIAV